MESKVQAQDDRQQDCLRQETPGQWRAAKGRGQEPRRVSSYAVSVDSGLRDGLTYFKFRFLQRPRHLRKRLP